MDDEIWRPVVGFEGLYEVSDMGRVKCLRRHRVREHVLSPSSAGRGYRKVQLCDKSRREHRYVHDLVLTAFSRPRPPGMECAHRNGKRDDNRLCNLRWDTRSGNHADKLAHGTAWLGEKHAQAKLTNAQVVAIRAAEGTCRAIGNAFGISPMQVSRIKRRKNWGHIPQ